MVYVNIDSRCDSGLLPKIEGNKMGITHKEVLWDKEKAIVKYYTMGADTYRKEVIKIINKLSKEYDKSIDIEHLKEEINDLKIPLIKWRYA